MEKIVFEEQESLRPEAGTDCGGLCTLGQEFGRYVLDLRELLGVFLAKVA